MHLVEFRVCSYREARKINKKHFVHDFYGFPSVSGTLVVEKAVALVCVEDVLTLFLLLYLPANLYVCLPACLSVCLPACSPSTCRPACLPGNTPSNFRTAAQEASVMIDVVSDQYATGDLYLVMSLTVIS